MYKISKYLKYELGYSLLKRTSRTSKPNVEIQTAPRHRGGRNNNRAYESGYTGNWGELLQKLSYIFRYRRGYNTVQWAWNRSEVVLFFKTLIENYRLFRC